MILCWFHRHYLFSMQEVFVMAAFLAHSSLTYSLMIYLILLKIFYRILFFYLMDQIKLYFICRWSDYTITIKGRTAKLRSQCFGPVLQIVDVKHKFKKENKVMIFQRRAKKYDWNFYIGNEKIDIVESCTYWESDFSNWEVHSVTREKAVHAQFSFKAPHRLQQFEPISSLQNFWHNDFTYSDL